MKVKILIVILLITCVNLHAQTVILYTDDFAGSSYEIDAGSYDYMTLLRAGITMVRSVRVQKGMQVTLYENDNYTGRSLVITEDAPMKYLLAKGYGQVAQNVSLVVAPYTKASEGPIVTIFKDNFSGTSKKLTEGFYDFMDLGTVGNDQLSSVRIPKGWRVTLYEHKESKGRTLVLTADASASVLLKNKFNDITSSILVEQLPPPEVPAPVKTPPVVPETKTPEDPQTPPPPAQPTASLDDPVNPMIIIYQGDRTGESKRLAPGIYDTDQLEIGDNEISSVHVPAGVSVVLYDQPKFKGKSLRLDEDASTAFLDAKGFNNVASSISVELTPRVMIYTDAFSGNSASFSPGYYHVNELGIENDELSSVRLFADTWVLLFEHNNFKGRSILLTKDASADFIAGKGFDNVASSMIVGTSDMPLPEVTIYRDNFANPLRSLVPGEYPVLENFNDQLSSLKIPRGLRVTLFEDVAFGGRSVTINTSVGDDFLRTNKFDNAVSSIKVEQVDPRDLVVTLYSETYQGNSQQLKPGRYLVRDITLAPNTLTSLRVPEGMLVTLYEHDNFRGVYETTDRDKDFSPFKMFDNFYSSFIVEDIFKPVISSPVVTTTTESQPIVRDKEPEPIVTTIVEDDRFETCKLSDNDYQIALKAIEKKGFSSDRMTVAQLATKNKCLTNNQIRGIAKLLGFEDQRLEFVKSMYDQAIEKSTYYTLDDVFVFMSSKDDFAKFLSSKE
ncbi:MAG TPA: beta/gamma crystallin-related protein [Cyclobacteriaceae bacterium]|nr:DUF4476 domain-containing protein [Cyclobacteriaceae bacterium]HMV08790.1 beta/gamma crystallin-related protein [Cyclobacteriaceae bacterium]HMV91507.1 beta/gamma crystallin-related protein [Cyclobacteriaceae bacterium]HMW99936.1 beta/gamma crystallin-related protein [Cyclobacteriaceae bacterium]HMX49201.1 beta/gamma crystallin-related protein [Cyclobacteriaceae bacterium]